MNTYDVTIGANGVFELHGRGRFLRLMTSTGPVDIEYYSAGRVIAQADGVEAGYAEEFDGQGFDRVRVSADPGVTIKAVLRESGRVAYDRGATAADVLSLPPVDVQSMPGVDANPVQIGGTVAALATAPAGVTQIVAPGANVGGLRIKTAYLTAGSNWGTVMAKAGAPAVWNDAGAVMMIAIGSSVQARDFLIPPGMGLYVGAAAASTVGVAITYDLLS